MDVISAWAAFLAGTANAALSPGPGTSEELAKGRAATISTLRYDLQFQIPDSKLEAVRGRETIRFTLQAPHAIMLDFDQPRNIFRSGFGGLSCPRATIYFAPVECTKQFGGVSLAT